MKISAVLHLVALVALLHACSHVSLEQNVEFVIQVTYYLDDLYDAGYLMFIYSVNTEGHVVIDS